MRVERQPPGTWSVAGLTALVTAVAVSVACGVSGVVVPREVLPGLPDPGQLTTVGLPAVKAIFDVSAVLTIGWLVAAAVLVPPERSGVFTVGGYRAARGAAAAAAAWLVSALVLIPLQVSEVLGAPLSEALRGSAIVGGVRAVDVIRAPLYAAGAALIIALAGRFLLRPGGALLALAVAVAGIAPVAVAGHAAQSGDHDLAGNTMLYHLLAVSAWVGGLVAVLGLARQRIGHLDVVVRRYSGLALIAFVIVTLSGAGNALIRLPRLSDLLGTDYGRLVLIKTAALVALGAIGWWHRRRTVPAVRTGDTRPLVRLAIGEVTLMTATIGVAVALGRTASPPPTGVVPDQLTEVLGYSLPGPPTLWRLLTAWRFDLVLGTGAILALACYLAGVWRLKRRGVDWPTGRTIAWIVGCVLVLLATSSGFGRYGTAQFSIHMIAHMTLGMMAPILLVLGGPMTLALRALRAAGRDRPPGPREALVRMLHSPLTRAVTNPLVVLALFIGSFYALYFTPIFGVLMDSHLGHIVMGLHFLVVGYLYYWVIIGVDPAPRRLPPMAKLGLLVGALPFHAFFGLALMRTKNSVAPHYFGTIKLPWVPDLVADERLGGAIAWGATEVPIIIVMLALLAQWATSDAKDARRLDKAGNLKAEEDLDAYNAMLAELAFRDVDRRAGNTSRSTPD